MENNKKRKSSFYLRLVGIVSAFSIGVFGLKSYGEKLDYGRQNGQVNEKVTEQRDLIKKVDNKEPHIGDWVFKNTDEINNIGIVINERSKKEDRQLLVNIYEKELSKYTYYYFAKQKLEKENTLELDDKQIEVAAKAYAYLKSEGVKEEQNIGTLVAMFLESGLRPYVISRDEYQFFGVLQWSYNLKKEYEEFLEKYNEENGTDYKFDDIEPQMAYYLKGSYDMFVKKGKSTVNIYNEQEFEDGAKAGKWLEQNYCRPYYIDYKAIEVVASAFEDAIEGNKTKAFKNTFERIETTKAFENRFLGNTTIKLKESNLGEILGKGIDR